MAAERAPAFQFYPKDFLTDERVLQMNHTEIGVYWVLCCTCWLEGSLPLETVALSKMLKWPLKRFTKFWEKSIVRHCFQLQDDGRLHHKRLDGEREKQEHHRGKQSKNGLKGGRPKSGGLATPAMVANPNESESKLSVLLSSSPELLKSADAEIAEAEVLVDRARSFVERYPRIYAECRTGAGYRIREARDFPAFEELTIREPDDGRLDALLKLFLTVKSRDFLNVPGTPRQFLHMLPECDRLLRENGR